MAGVCEDMAIDAVWLYFASPLNSADWQARFVSVEAKRKGFTWAVSRLVETGRLRLRDKSTGVSACENGRDAVARLSRSMPSTGEQLDDGLWSSTTACPHEAEWRP